MKILLASVQFKLRQGLKRILSLVTVVWVLQGCSGGSDGGASEREGTIDNGSGGAFVYSGPAPASAEIQNFKVAFFDNLVLQDRCGSCHTNGGPGPTHFVDNDDVNYAWQQANTVVDLSDPAASLVVQRVANGHNCWLGANQTSACATTLTSYIERWAQGSVSSVSQVQLTPIPAVSPSGTKQFPDFASLSAAQLNGLTSAAPPGLLYLLNTHCSGCHSDTAAVPQSPFFASDDQQIAYDAVRSKIDLITPTNSRVVQRLEQDSHNCWTNDCDSDASLMEAAVTQLAGTVPVTQVDTDLLVSRAVVLDTHGIVASTGGRYETNVIAKWEFREGQGTAVADTSGVQPEVPLTLTGNYSWLGGWGVNFVDGKAQGAVSGSSKLRTLISGTGEYSIEAWVAPNNVSQENAWIAGYAGGTQSRNFLMAQNLYDYDFYNRSSANDDNGGGNPALSTDDNVEFAQATLQHVVMTFDPVNGRRTYVNGQFTGDIDSVGGGVINTWNASFAMVLGNSTASDAPWAGTMRMVAVHNRSLTPAQIQQNFDVGVGARFYLLFSVSEILDRPGECHTIDAGARTNYCYVVFEVSQFDAGSYLFNTPFFISLNSNFNPDGFNIRGIYLGINGKLAETGQGYVNVNAVVNGVNYSSSGQSLASIGSIIALENGSDQDTFFLAFDEIDGQFDARTPETPLAYAVTLNGQAASDIGFRTFEEISATFSAITGVATTDAGVSSVFNTVKQAMPETADFQAYLSSHHMAVTQLAISYCDALVNNTTLRDALFTGAAASVFGTRADLVADAAWTNNIIDPLLTRSFATGLSNTQPDFAGVSADLLNLITDTADNQPYIFSASAPGCDTNPANPGHSNCYISDPARAAERDGLARCGAAGNICPVGRTDEVVKAVCASVLGSAAVLLQ